MNEAIPIKSKPNASDVHDDLDEKLSDIYAVAALLAAMDSDRIFIGQVNATGYCLTRMIKEAQKLSEEHLTLWQGGAS